MEERQAPFYLRRVKEALVTFPNPETGEAKSLFTWRNVKTVPFKIDDEELDFYDALTRYVEDQSIKVASDDSARGRALCFPMAMLQRRLASSFYAVRRSLEPMKAEGNSPVEEEVRKTPVKTGMMHEVQVRHEVMVSNPLWLTASYESTIVDGIANHVLSGDNVELPQKPTDSTTAQRSSMRFKPCTDLV
jgi:hypothetical protein